MDLFFLGTSAAVPSKQRSTSCVAVREGADVILFDCGEGSQRQIMASPVSFMKIRAILISHMHGDHIFGLPGLLQTMGLSERKEPLTVYGPRGLAAFVESTMSLTEDEDAEAPYSIIVAELDGGEEFTVRGFSVKCFRTEHGMMSLGYVLRQPDRPGKLDHRKALELGIRDGPDMARLKNGEAVGDVRPEDVIGPSVPGLSVAYTGDTRPCGSTVENVAGVDVLIHEATYMDSEARNAAEHNHSTAAEAARVAKEAGVRHLILTHISHRYDDREAVAAEARAIFPETYAAEDMEMYQVTRGGISVKDVRQA
ncbi:MAG: ribonuclease Z [Thermoplasmata archaeon]|nr:ribonuclease Z [Thermoplasmata archaeon]